MQLQIIDNINNLDKLILKINKIIAQTCIGEITILNNHCELLTKIDSCQIFINSDENINTDSYINSNATENISNSNNKDDIVYINFDNGILLIKDNKIQINCIKFAIKEN